VHTRLGHVVLARSGGNARISFSFQALPLSCSSLSNLGDEYFSAEDGVSEYPTVYFVVYGVVRLGISGSSRRNAFVRGMEDWLVEEQSVC
jgi:hypothetical protein